MTLVKANKIMFTFYDFICFPHYLQGGAFCQFIFKPKLYPEVTSGRATFETLGTFQLERLSDGSLLGKIPGL